MTSSGTFGVHFIIRNNKQLNGKSPVYARITVNGTRCELALKEYLSPTDWNFGNGKAWPKNNALKKFNSYLEEVREKLALHNFTKRSKKAKTPSVIHQIFNNLDARRSLVNISFFEYSKGFD